MNTPKRVVYVAQHSTYCGYAKIGISTNFEKDLKKWNFGQPQQFRYKPLITCEVSDDFTQDDATSLFGLKQSQQDTSDKSIYQIPENLISEVVEKIKAMAKASKGGASVRLYDNSTESSKTPSSVKGKGKGKKRIKLAQVQVPDGAYLEFQDKSNPSNPHNGDLVEVKLPCSILYQHKDGHIEKTSMSGLAFDFIPGLNSRPRGTDFFFYEDPQTGLKESIVQRFERLKLEGKIQ